MNSSQTRTLIEKLKVAYRSEWVSASCLLLFRQSIMALEEGLPRLMAEESRLVGAPPMPQRWQDLHDARAPWERGE